MRNLDEELIKYAEDNDNIRALVLQESYINDKADCAYTLLASYGLVRYLGKYIGESLNFIYPDKEEKDMLEYCKKQFRKYCEVNF